VVDISARNKRNKRKGADWEADLVEWFRDNNCRADRLHLSGKEDEGDLYVESHHPIVVPSEFIVEAKNVQAIDLAGFIRELEAERANYAKHRKWLHPINGYVIIKRRGKPVEDSYVVTTLKEMF